MASHETMFDEAFNEAYGMVEFGCLSFGPATVLKECDPIAYRCAVSDYDCDGDPGCDDCKPGVDPYNVYASMDGSVYDEESFEDINDAYAAFDALVVSYRADAKLGILAADATIHLYNPFGGNMVAETHVSQYNTESE